LDLYCRSFLFSGLLPTFRDAAVITRAFGIKYLWIDSLCILQDSRDDLLTEPAMMGSVYKNARVTIAADASQNRSVGIVGSSFPSRNSKVPLSRTQCHSKSRNLSGFLYFDKYDDDINQDEALLSQRGWTLQEEMLSPRILKFQKNCVLWRFVES
jgi:hypothetical protein